MERFGNRLVCSRVKMAMIGCAFTGLALTACDINNVLRGSFGDSASEKGTPLSVSLSKTTPTTAILKCSDDSNDDSYFLISTFSSQKPTTFRVGSKVYFQIPSKRSNSSAGGWHYSLAHWTPGQSSATWIDGDGGTAGIQAVLLRSDVDKNGFQLRNHRETHFVFTGSKYLGITKKYFSTGEYGDISASGYYWVGIDSANPEALSGLEILVDSKNIFSINDNDNTWKGATKDQVSLYYQNGTVYIYQTQSNAPTEDTYYIALTTTTDMVSLQLPTEPLLTGYSRPNVFEFNNKVYMIAFNHTLEQWQMIPGDSFTNFFPSKAVSLTLGARLLGTSLWDDTVHYTDLPNGEPRLAGVEVLNEKIYLFYLAGGFNQLSGDPTSGGAYHGVPYDGPRGVGVFELEISEEIN